MEWKWDNSPQRRVSKQRDPILDVMNEPLSNGQGKLSTSQVLMLRQIKKAFNGDKDSLVISLKRGARRERKLTAEGRYDEHTTFETLNLNYETVGDVAEYLGIARKVDAPPKGRRNWYEREQRHDVENWVIAATRSQRGISDQDFAQIQAWRNSGCPQWRYKTQQESDTGQLPDEFHQAIKKAAGRPKGSKNKPKTRIHPYDQKVNLFHGGKRRTVRVMEALVLTAHKHLENHPNDTQVSNLLLDIHERAQVAREKRREGPEINEPLRIEGDDRLYAPLTIASFEAALMALGGADILYPYRPYARAMLEPWLVQLALDRRKTRFTRSQQQRIVNRTRQPGNVNWPERFDRDVIEYRGPGRPAAEDSKDKDGETGICEAIPEKGQPHKG